MPERLQIYGDYLEEREYSERTVMMYSFIKETKKLQDEKLSFFAFIKKLLTFVF